MHRNETVGNEIADAHDALDEWGIPRERDVTLSLRERITILAEDREQASEKLSDVWIILESWAHDKSIQPYIRVAAGNILRQQNVPGWTCPLAPQSS